MKYVFIVVLFIMIYIEREYCGGVRWCYVCVCDRVLVLAPNGGLLLFIVVTFGCFDMRHTHRPEMTQMCNNYR